MVKLVHNGIQSILSEHYRSLYEGFQVIILRYHGPSLLPAIRQQLCGIIQDNRYRIPQVFMFSPAHLAPCEYGNDCEIGRWGLMGWDAEKYSETRKCGK